ncbi:EF-hand domain-containing protein [Paraburkholderia sp. DHOC27]|uniref:EF-hand domain-containing protein n=1 Tax=Paraburkholderia sp. DHOC27 TaxID=2303330 RepID=UPI000E3B85AB|nr:EF-hand domain-containing protein [Paraburkholderia sp. DHOC27]RFU44174.1 EF-hand domain-containing protein [Paraburkholderia sp. DHOC27]
MSVNAVASNNSANRLLENLESALNQASDSTATQAANQAPTSPSAATGETATPESSAQVTLSAAGQILAQLAAAGITFTMSGSQGTPLSPGSLADVNLPSKAPKETDDDWAMQVCSALAASGFNVSMTDPGGVSMSVGQISASAGASGESIMQLAQQTQQGGIAPPTHNGTYDGSISQSDAESVIEQFGGTSTQAKQIFTALDTDQNGSLSNAELLSAISQFGSSTASTEVQALEKLLVPDGSSTLTEGALLGFESAMVAAEKPAS